MVSLLILCFYTILLGSVAEDLPSDEFMIGLGSPSVTVTAVLPECLRSGSLVQCWVVYSDGTALGPQSALPCKLNDSFLEDTSKFTRIVTDQVWKGLSQSHLLVQMTCEGHLENITLEEESVCTKYWCLEPHLPNILGSTAFTRKRRSADWLVDSDGCKAPAVLSQLYGTIASPDYPHDYPSNRSCKWIVQPLTGYRIAAYIEYMNISTCTNGSCCDYVSLTYDGDSSKLMCGLRSGLEPVHINNGNLTVNFLSDGYGVVGSNGFRLFYQQEKVLFTDLQGVIKSPNYGEKVVSLYPNNMRFYWWIQVVEGYHLLIQFAEPFHIEGEQGHCVDRLERGSGLQVGISTYSPDLCGRKTPAMYYTLSNKAWFSMHTDSSGRYSGFKLHYTAERRVFNESAGTLTSPLYPENFPSPIYTEYFIHAPLGYIIYLTVEVFDVPSCSLDNNGFCVSCADSGSYLEIATSPGPFSDYIHERDQLYTSRRFCNGLEPQTNLMSIENDVKITFNSGGTTSGKGFNISYLFIPNHVYLPEQLTAKVMIPAGYQTLGFIYLEIMIPKGHNLRMYVNHLKLNCALGEGMVFVHSFEDLLEGNALSICDKDEHSDWSLWIQPQDKIGVAEWTMMLIIQTNYTQSVTLLSFLAENPVVRSSSGVILGQGSGTYWASYKDLSRDLPYIASVLSTPTCKPMIYKVLEAPSCESDAKAVLRSPYNIPHGRDKLLCNISADWSVIEGNEMSLLWRPSKSNDTDKSEVLLAYGVSMLSSDCLFEIDMCDWVHRDTTHSSVRWTRTSEEALPHIAGVVLMGMRFTDYYMHVHMNEGYAGEKAQMMSPVMSNDVSRSLSFKYHMHGSYVGHLNVYIWSPSNDLWRLVWSQYAMSNTSWQRVSEIMISSCSDYHVVFEATIPVGSTSSRPGDVAVDDILFCEYPVGVTNCNTSECGTNGRCIDAVPSTLNDGSDFECCCDAGHMGTSCETRLDMCADGELTCLNNGSCITWQVVNRKLVPAMCRCKPGFTGERCEEEIDECVSTPCQNDARCVDGVDSYHCLCPMHYSGVNCEISHNVCEMQKPCDNGGTCVTLHPRGYRCICPLGFTGNSCQQEVNECSSRPCLNGGICMDKLNGFQCRCQKGYKGKRCEININSCADASRGGLCHNGASCLDTVNGFQCQCEDGWQGMSCDSQIDDCLIKHCVNGARCVDRHRDFQCLCKKGFYGKRCELAIDYCKDNRCINGFCEQSETGQRCNCLDGYSGELCQLRVSGCANAPCAAGASCVDLPEAKFYCTCANGRTGRTCKDKVDYCKDVDTCLNGATCVSMNTSFRCDCAPGFRGHLCEYETSGCGSRQCLHGTCLDYGHDGFKCRCDDGWSGLHCEREDHRDVCGDLQPCYNGATCVSIFNNFICICVTGYAGTLCNININDCESEPCLNNGLCIDGVNSFTCQCRRGYGGLYCGQYRDPCETLHCVNGECVLNRQGAPTCRCYKGFVGTYCQDVVANCALLPCHKSAVCQNLMAGYFCECNPELPLQGKHCDVDVDICQANVCLNGGICKSYGFDYSCQCIDGTRGHDCATVVKPCDRNPCKHGHCVDIDDRKYLCKCDAGWTNTNCDEQEDVCSSYKCENGGSCYMNTNGKAFCICRQTYTGLRCERAVNPCWNRACYNGVCQVGSEGELSGIAYCNCEKGFGGYYCEVDLRNGQIRMGERRQIRSVKENGPPWRPNVSIKSSMEEMVICHPLGNNTDSSTKWVIGAITVGMYIIVILLSATWSIISLRFYDRVPAEGGNFMYYTPLQYPPPLKFKETPVKKQSSYFTPKG